MCAAVPSLRSIEDFRTTFSSYHDATQPGDTIVYLYVFGATEAARSRSSPPEPDEVALILNGYLRAWGGMTRYLGGAPELTDEDPYHARILDALRNDWPEIARLRDVDGLTSPKIPESLSTVFDHIMEASRTFRRKQRRYVKSAVLAAKLLHILLPKLCIIWDSTYVLNRGLMSPENERVWFNSNGEGYGSYLEGKFDQVRYVAEKEGLTPATLTERITKEHGGLISAMFPSIGLNTREPLTKILDEANYL